MTDRTGELVEQYSVEITDEEKLEMLMKTVKSMLRMFDRTIARVVVLELKVAELEMEVMNLKSTVAYMVGD